MFIGEMLLKLGELYRKLVDDDFKLLYFIVKNIKRFEYVPIELIIRKFEKKYTQKEIIARIKKLIQLRLIARHSIMNSYRITFLGLDCIALNYLVKKDIVKAIGDKISVGKESEIFKGLSVNDKVIAIKFYRIGKQCFRHITKTRGYYEYLDRSSWIYRSIIAGEREKNVLTTLNKYGIPGIPRIYGGVLHCIVMEYIEGTRLSDIALALNDPYYIFKYIIDIVKRVYKTTSIVHGDLSEYNIMINSKDVKVYIIDWPQYVLSNNPLALQLLKRDIENITKFFRRRFRLDIDPQKILKYVLE